MIVADKLRKAILQAAIQGKLTEQLESDGDARDLLVHIQAEKARLVKTGKIKQDKPLPAITEEEKPFVIPDNWCWVRLGEIGETNIGLTYKTSDVSNSGTLVLRSGNIVDDKIDYSDRIFVSGAIPENKKCYIGDILICARNGSKKLVGKAALIDSERMTFGAFMALYRSPFNLYIHKYLSSPYFRSDLDGVNTTTINQITQNNLKERLLPLPPLAEQHRIVKKIEECFALIKELAIDEQKLANIEKAFPKQMKDSLLQAAIQGKLTQQLASDGDARQLLADIRAEKKRLIKAGKIKKEKPLPEITEDEIPFAIPDNWCWVRLGEITNYGIGKQIDNKNIPNESWILELEDIEKETFRLISKRCDRKPNSSKNKFQASDILYGKLRPYLQKVIIADGEGFCSTEIIPFSGYGGVNNRYLQYCMVSPSINYNINQITHGMDMPRLGTDKAQKLVVPLPPLAEQQRIVERLEQLLPLCGELANDN